MAVYDYDVIVIGSGPAGEGAAINAAKRGRRVAVVEEQASTKETAEEQNETDVEETSEEQEADVEEQDELGDLGLSEVNISSLTGGDDEEINEVEDTNNNIAINPIEFPADLDF